LQSRPENPKEGGFRGGEKNVRKGVEGEGGVLLKKHGNKRKLKKRFSAGSGTR